MKVRLFLLSSAFLMVTDLAGLAAAPLGPTSTPEAAPVFRPYLDRMWRLSATFRRQCSRLAAGSGLRVRVLVEDSPVRSLSFNARTILKHLDGALVFAEVYLKPSLDAPELIANELEHIFEQLDGVDLKAQAGTGAVWKSGDGSFETRRAVEAGRRVAREITTASVSGVLDRRLDPRADRLTVAQGDRAATPGGIRSARVSRSGRHVVFTSSARLVEADRNQFRDVYVLDLATGHYTLQSDGPGGSAGNGESLSPDIRSDGRYVVFESAAGNLTDTQFLPGTLHVFLRDCAQGTTRLLTANTTGEPANGNSANPAINAGGTAVVFESTATDLMATGGMARSSVGIYLMQFTSGLRTQLDVTSAGAPPGSRFSPAS